MRLRSLALVPLLAASFAAVHCGGTVQGTGDGGTPSGEGGTIDKDGGIVDPNPDATGLTTSGKVDLLLVVDNSASMSDKAQSLSASIGTLLRKVVPGRDVHVGVISSSLGTFGGDVCANSGPSNGLAHLRTVGPDDAPIAAAAGGFLSYGGGSDVEALVTNTQALVKGVGQNGCGLEAQLESAYRFLVQPDPWGSVQLDAFNQAAMQGVDDTVLAQRKAFLRPDSLVAVVMLTDEDDSSPDPLALGGQGWAFGANQFPGSTVFRADGKTTTAPRATSVCASDPGSADCTSCGFAPTCNASEPACAKIKADPECQKNGGYYGPAEDQLNVRFQRMKERYGIDPQYPISRYVDGFTKQRAPKRDGEHVETARGGGQGRDIGPYVGTPSCTNPLFAASLPGSSGDELCNLPQGPRGKELVVFALIGGLPQSLAGANPDWTKILGANPEAFDFAGIDPHMIQSTTPRAGLAPPSSTPGDNGPDPVHGREWLTGDDDLQFACTFALPTTRVCTAQDPSCDCARGGDRTPPLCAPGVGQQTRGKAYPTVRELRVAKALGDRAVVGSACASDAAQGYTSTMALLADRMAPRLAK
jgi:hypothetical protein